jgi:hypothetical protein
MVHLAAAGKRVRARALLELSWLPAEGNSKAAAVTLTRATLSCEAWRRSRAPLSVSCRITSPPRFDSSSFSQSVHVERRCRRRCSCCCRQGGPNPRGS